MTSRLQNFPISAFSIILGLAGYTMATQRVFTHLGWGDVVPTILLFLTTALYLVLLGFYVAKAFRYRAVLLQELRHPVKLSFYPTIGLSLLLLSAGYLDVQRAVSFWLWVIGAVLQLGFTLLVLSIWIRHTKFEITHFSPAWFIPVVGNLAVPLAGVEHAPTDISWLFFAPGVFFAVVLMTILFYRVFFHQPLPERLVPTLFIMIAPPALGAVAYVKLTHTFDSFARVLYFLAVFCLLLLLAQARMFSRVHFYLSWWAYSFPLAAFTVATFLMGRETGASGYQTAAVVLWVLLSLLMVVLLARTGAAVGRREICVED